MGSGDDRRGENYGRTLHREPRVADDRKEIITCQELLIPVHEVSICYGPFIKASAHKET